MNEENGKKRKRVSAGKECAYLAMFTAILLAAQFCFSFFLGVEIVTSLFFSHAFVFGGKRGALVGVAFSLLRILIFGFFPSVLLLYLLYYPSTAFLFGWLGKKVKRPLPALWWLTVIACLCSLCFSLLDGVITPLWYRFTLQATRAYLLASLPVAGVQILCTAGTVGLLFVPLQRVFHIAKKGLEQ